MPQVHQHNLPALRFPEFKKAWVNKSLGIIFTFKNGVNADKSQYGYGYKFINVLDIIADEPITSDSIIGSVSISEKEFEKNKVVFGDILFQRSSETREEVGQSNVYLDESQPATFGGFVIRGHPIVEIIPRYFDALLKTSAARKDITSRSGGSTRYNVGQESLSAVKVTVSATLPEQQKIAAFLSSVDRKIAQVAQKKALLEQYKRGCMQKLFSQELRFKNAQGNDFPDWEEKRLGDVAERCTRKNLEGKHTRVLTNSAVRGVIDQGDYFDHAVANAENLGGYYIVEMGDFVYNPRISVSAPVGPIKRNDLGAGVMSPLYSVFRFNSENTEFYEQYYSSSFWHRYMKSVANYGARHDRMAISTKDFMNMPLPNPCPEEQQKIADFLSSIDRKIGLVATELDHAKAFKKGLLQQMFI